MATSRTPGSCDWHDGRCNAAKCSPCVTSVRSTVQRSSRLRRGRQREEAGGASKDNALLDNQLFKIQDSRFKKENHGKATSYGQVLVRMW